ncbi:MAG TPA: cytochrome c3 family protein, partial [Coriobacteriia bacterium]|nr:cytochrome c3 family protein [Coriobacteriia bacterium]
TYRVGAADAAGNASAQSAPVSATTPVLDTTPPHVTLSVAPPAPDGAAGWWVSVPAVTAAVDETATVFYRFSATDDWVVWTDTTVPIPASHIPEGPSTLSYYARDLAQNVSPVASLPLQVDTFSPSTPALTATASGTDSVELAWTPTADPAPGSGLAAYEVYRLPEHSIVATVAADGTGHPVTGLTPNTLYEFYVRSVDSAGNRSAPSNTVSVTTDSDDVSAPRTTLSLSPPAPDGDNGWYRTKPVMITLAPDASIPSTVYYAWGQEPATADGWQPYTAPLPVFAEGISILYYYARPVEAFRLSEPVRWETVKVDTIGPSAATDLAWLQQGVDGALLSWAPAADGPGGSGVAHYEVLVDGVVRQSSTFESVLLTGLAPEVDHIVSVRAVDSAGNRSELSGAITVRLEAIIVPPEPPSRVVARAIEDATVFVAWDPSPTVMTAPVTYHVFRSADGVTYDSVGTVMGALNRTFVDSSVSPRSSYHYAVSVETSGVVGPLSSTSATDAPHAAVHLTSAPPIPRNLVARVQPSGSVVLEWSPVGRPGIVAYNVYRATESGAEPVLVGTVVDPGVYTFTDAATASYARYWYSVAAVDDGTQAGSRSSEVHVRVRVETPVGTVVPHASFADSESRRCQLCHAVAQAGSGEALLTTPSSRALCETCHDGTGASTAITDDLDPTGRLHADTGGTLTCTDCHAPHSAGTVEEMGPLLRSDGVTAGNEYCYTCHGQTAEPPLGDMRSFEGSVHATVSAGTAGITCLNCHEAHASAPTALGRYAYPGACLRCHGDSAAAEKLDILTRVTQSTETSAGHDILGPGGAMTCRTCHSPHAASAAYPLVDPRVVGGGESWQGSTTEFCLTCHAGTPPEGLQAAPDVSAKWNASSHGPGVDAGGSARFLRPDMGFSTGETLSCAACHEPHRAPNVGNLRGDVRSKDQASVQTGLLAVDVPGGGTDIRHFCRACHDLPDTAHPDIPGASSPGITSFPIDCTACHNHEAGL